MEPLADSLVRWPRLLVFSEGALSRSHGTGTIFVRTFAAYPRERLANWFIGGSDDPLFPDAVNLTACRWPRHLLSPPTTLLAKLWNRFRLRPFWTVPVNQRALSEAARRQKFVPEAIYAIILSREGIDALQGVLAGLPPSLPVILQIQDFFPTGSLGFMRALRRLAPRLTEVWGISQSILQAVAPHLPGVPQRFDPLCYIDLPAQPKMEHRPFGPEFRTVIIGNFWNPALLADVQNIWRELRRQMPGLPPVRWHCHPSGIERVRAAGYEPGPELELAPFLSGEALFAELRRADLALIPFSQEEHPRTDYERFSMPSRITELSALGLPIFCLTGAGTPLYDYVTAHGIGLCVPARQTAQAVAGLRSLILDPAARSRLGTAARRHAEAHFQVQPFQAWLADKFRSLSSLPAK